MNADSFFGKWILVGVLMCLPGWGRGQGEAPGRAEVTIHLKGGQVLEGEVIEVGKEDLKWSFPGASGASSTPYAQIDYVELPDYSRFRFSDENYESGDVRRARDRFEKIVSDNEPGGFFPVPGNYIDRARLRLVRIYRQEVNAAKVAEHYRALDEARLPPRERTLKTVDEVWALVGEEKWDEVAKLVERSGNRVGMVSSDGAEMAYLLGLAKEALGNGEEALEAYFRSYAFNYSGNLEASRLALKSAVTMTAEADPADDGIVPMLKLYASAFGKGKLWEGHPEALGERLVEALKKEAPGTDTGADVVRETEVAKEAMEEGEGVVLKTDFEPGARLGRIRGKGSWDMGELGAGFRSSGPEDSYTLTSEDGLEDTGGAAVFEPGYTYSFSVTTVSDPDPDARCRVEMGYLKNGKFVLLRRIDGTSGVGGRAGSRFRFRHLVTVRIDKAERGKEHPVAVRLSGVEGTTLFLNDGVVKRVESD